MTVISSNKKDWFFRWYITFSDYATIIEPERFKLRIMDILKQAVDKL
ncbi:hypothetical protein [Winogradskyella schleiferi]|nr:hypothetical protein [Winogradskyella schleiferi]